VALLVNPANPAHTTIRKNTEAATQKAGVRMLYLEARNPQEIEIAFATMFREKVGAVIVEPDGFLFQQRSQIAELAIKNRLPTISGFPEQAEAGGLMSYGTDLIDQYRRAATYVDKIFKGAKPTDLPIEQPTKYELIINGKTAKAFGPFHTTVTAH
jgi:putative ABC transport system substrate-binding protein